MKPQCMVRFRQSKSKIFLVLQDSFSSHFVTGVHNVSLYFFNIKDKTRHYKHTNGTYTDRNENNSQLKVMTLNFFVRVMVAGKES